MTYTAWFDEIRKDDIALAGGKGANLGELSHAGLPVPPGFVVTTTAYDAFVEANSIGDAIVGRASVTRADDPAGVRGGRGGDPRAFLRRQGSRGDGGRDTRRLPRVERRRQRRLSPSVPRPPQKTCRG